MKMNLRLSATGFTGMFTNAFDMIRIYKSIGAAKNCADTFLFIYSFYCFCEVKRAFRF